MKLIRRILNRIAFIRAECLPDGSFQTEVQLWRSGALAPAERSAAKNAMAVVVVCGHGVVTKPDDSSVAARVGADPETFLRSAVGRSVSFVRRDRLQPLTEELSGEGIVPVRIFCTDSAADFGVAANEYARQLYAELTWKALLRPSADGSAALQPLIRRCALPVLGLFLLLLAANAVLSPRLAARQQALQAELTIRERSQTESASADRRRQSLLAEFAPRYAVRRSVLCDRIAEAAPDRITLTALSVEPLAKRFEAEKPLLRREGTVVIGGTAPAAADVSAFVQRLSALRCCRDVRLANVERERDSNRLTFRIETAL